MRHWIVSDKEHLGGAQRVRGTRISIAFLLESLAAGISLVEIVRMYPTLKMEAVQGVLAELALEKKKAA